MLYMCREIWLSRWCDQDQILGLYFVVFLVITELYAKGSFKVDLLTSNIS